jgi:hypothetical protein
MGFKSLNSHEEGEVHRHPTNPFKKRHHARRSRSRSLPKPQNSQNPKSQTPTQHPETTNSPPPNTRHPKPSNIHNKHKSTKRETVKNAHKSDRAYKSKDNEVFQAAQWQEEVSLFQWVLAVKIKKGFPFKIQIAGQEEPPGV